MRIVQLTKDWLPNGGVAVYVQDLTAALAAAGHEVAVVHADPGAAARTDGPSVEKVFIDGFDDRATGDRRTADVLQAVARLRPDLVHVQGNNNLSLEDELRRRHPTVKTLHAYDFCPAGTKFHYRPRRPCRHPTGVLCLPRMGYQRCLADKRPQVFWRFYRRAVDLNRHAIGYHALIVASDYVRAQAIATGYRPERVRVVPYFTNVPPVPPPAARETILFSGRVVREKGLHVLLDALSRLDRPWRLVVAGDGFGRAAAERLAARRGFGDRVVFCGWLERADLSREYAAAAVVALPSLWPEPFGIVGLEAMARARPVVAFAVGGIPEWLEDGRTGFLVPPYDVAAFAARLDRLLGEPGLAAEMGARGRARIERDFGARAHLDRLLEVYASVMHAGAPA